MTLKVYSELFKTELVSVYSMQEVSSFLYMLLDHRLNISKTDYLLGAHKITLNTIDELYFKEVLRALKKQKPIQYILGETWFYNLLFSVNKHTLIPRPETEELVSWICTDYKSHKSELKIIDIGTGSGCIPISLAKNISSTNVFGVDVSKDALVVAKENANTHKANVSFIQADVLCNNDLELLSENGSFDVIVSNPPYVRDLEKQEIKKNVLAYEPHLALFVSDHDPLIFYRTIAQFAKNNLSKNGRLYFEVNQYLGPEMIVLLKEIGFKSVELKKDFSGNDRMIKAYGL